MSIMFVLSYVGPGAGLGFLGSLLAILAVVFVGLIGLVLYPVKLIISRFRARSAAAVPDKSVQCETPPVRARAA